MVYVSKDIVLRHFLKEETKKKSIEMRKVEEMIIDYRINGHDETKALFLTLSEVRSGRHGFTDPAILLCDKCEWEETEFEINQNSIQKITTWGDKGWRDLSENTLSMLKVVDNVRSGRFQGHELHESITNLNVRDDWLEQFKPIIVKFENEDSYLFADGGHRVASLIYKFLENNKPIQIKSFIGRYVA